MDLIEELTTAKKKFGSKAERIKYFDEVSREIAHDRETRDHLMAAYRSGDNLTSDGYKPFGGNAPSAIGERVTRKGVK